MGGGVGFVVGHLVFGDEGAGAFAFEVGPDPLAEDGEAAAEADEEKDVDEEPEQPGDDAGEAAFADFGDGAVVADGGHGAAVFVGEFAAWLAAEIAEDVFGGGFALLHGGGGEAGDLFSFGVGEGGHVADDEDFAVAGEAQIFFDGDAAGAVGFGGEFFAERRGCDSGGPESDVGAEPVFADFDAARFHAGDEIAGEDFDAEFFKLLFGFAGGFFGESAEDSRRAFVEADAGLAGVDDSKVFREDAFGEIGDGAGEFDAGGAAADDGEVERGSFAGEDGGAFGFFEGEQQAAADFHGVLDRFQSGGFDFPFVMAEVGMAGSGGDD